MGELGCCWACELLAWPGIAVLLINVINHSNPSLLQNMCAGVSTAEHRMKSIFHLNNFCPLKLRVSPTTERAEPLAMGILRNEYTGAIWDRKRGTQQLLLVETQLVNDTTL